MIEEINSVIESKIRPLLTLHNGDIKLINFENGIVEVMLLGACSNCPSAKFTIEDLVESNLCEIPGVNEVKVIDTISNEMLDFAISLLRKEA